MVAKKTEYAALKGTKPYEKSTEDHRADNENGGHTIVSLAGLGMGDHSVAQRQMTAAWNSIVTNDIPKL